METDNGNDAGAERNERGLSDGSKATQFKAGNSGPKPGTGKKSRRSHEAIDEGEGRIGAMIDKLEREWKAEQAREDAELAARPNAAETAGTLQKRLAIALQREERLRQRVEQLEKQLAIIGM